MNSSRAMLRATVRMLANDSYFVIFQGEKAVAHKKLICVVVAMLLSGGRSSWGGVLYTVTDLGMGPGSVATDINASGQIVGGYYPTGDYEHAVLWSAGQITDLGTGVGVMSEACAINAGGQIVGTITRAGVSSSLSNAFYYNNSTMTAMDNSYATDINDAGQIIGGHQGWSGEYNAFIWDGSEIDPNINPNPHTTNLRGVAKGINASGQIVGRSFSPDSAAFLNIDGAPTVLGGLPSGTSTQANAINASGQVAGITNPDSGYDHAFFWQSDSGMQDLGTLGGVYSAAHGINNRGQVVGESSLTTGYEHHAILWQSDCGMLDLNSLIEPTCGWMLVRANAINDNGWIVGYGTNQLGQASAFLLTPVPEPSTFVLLAMGVISLYAWRRQAA